MLRDRAMKQESLANCCQDQRQIGRRTESSILHSAAPDSNLPSRKKTRRNAETKLRAAESAGHYFFASVASL
jgi:hypothetical protein